MLDFNDAGPQFKIVDPIAWDARIETLRQALKQHARDVVEAVFPRARFQANEARIGNVNGDRGESLSIALSGDGAGLWYDHADERERGDLIALWMATQGRDFAEAISDLEEYLQIGTTKPRFHTRVHAVSETRRAEVAKEPKIDDRLPPPTISYHYLAADGSLAAIVRRYDLDTVDEKTGKRKKTFRPFTAAGEPRMPDPRPLYRIPSIMGASQVILVEGEKCADALERVGVGATTQMGGSKADPAKTDWSPLAGKSVLVWEDNDPAGEGLTERVRASLEAIGCTVCRLSIPAGKPLSWDAADAVEAGEDVLAIITGPAVGIPTTRFRIYTIDELALIDPPEWRIDGIFPKHGSSTIYGAYESFKTWIALDMLLHLAAEKDWHGRKSNPCSVLYVAGEGQYGIAHRVLGWCSARNGGTRPSRFRALPEAVAVPVPGDLDDLLRQIDKLPEPPGVIALDTITRMAGGGSLNDEKDMQAYVRGMDRLRTTTGAHVMNIGHSGKDKEKGLLGSVVLPAAMEAIICVERKADAVMLINSNPKGKQKDGPNFEDINLVSRNVAFERNGVFSDTLIFMPDDPIIIENDRPEPAQRLGPLEQRILAVLGQAASAGQGLRPMRLKLMLDIEDKNKSSLFKALRHLQGVDRVEKRGEEWWLS